jgi:DivIVA domain-containing protein
MTGQSSGSRFPRHFGRPGYRPADVDAFIDRIEATLSGAAAGRRRGPSEASGRPELPATPEEKVSTFSRSSGMMGKARPGWDWASPAGPFPERNRDDAG